MTRQKADNYPEWIIIVSFFGFFYISGCYFNFFYYICMLFNIILQQLFIVIYRPFSNLR